MKEIKPIEENKSTRIKRALYGDSTGKIRTFAILSAENPNDTQLSSEENNKRTERLKRIFKQMGIQYIPFQGMYNRKEHSFIAINLSLGDAKRLTYLSPDESIEDMQESFFFGNVFSDGVEIRYYARPKNSTEFELIETSDRVDNAKDFDNFFSQYHDFKFSIWMKVFNESWLDIVDDVALDESVSDSITPFGRMVRRRKSVGKFNPQETGDELDESNRAYDFSRKSKRRFFATISAFVDKQFFNNDETKEDKFHHDSYNNRATNQLLNDLKRLGLDYQKVVGIWDGETENSYVVWNTAYTYEEFRNITLKLAETFKQWAVCVGRYVGEESSEDLYSVELYVTDSLENIEYKLDDTFKKISLNDALAKNKTILTRHIYNSDREIDTSKTNQSFVFEELVENRCLASSESLLGAYKRSGLLKEYLEKITNY